MQLFARQALRQQTLGTVRMAQAIGVAFGGKEAFLQLLDELE